MKPHYLVEDELIKACGSKYMAVNVVADMARRKAQAVDYHILDSQAIEWVLSGEKPQTIIDDENSESRRKSSYMRNLLEYIDDDRVVDSVISSIRASVASGTLCFVFSEDTNEYQYARVRILCRMIWYHKG